MELNNQYLKWESNTWDFQHCVLPSSEPDITWRKFGYPAWSRSNCEEFLRFQIAVNCSATMTVGNTINESARNYTGKLFFQSFLL